MRVAILASSVVLNYLILISWFGARSTAVSLTAPVATAITFIGVAIAAVFKDLVTKGSYDAWYVGGVSVASLLFAVTALAIGWGLANPVREVLPFGPFVQSALATSGVWLVGTVVGATLMAYGGLFAGRQIRRRRRNIRS